MTNIVFIFKKQPDWKINMNFVKRVENSIIFSKILLL
jgi:hypothetical protein